MPLRDHFDLVIFDWAGTMVDFGCQAPVQALKEAFARHGVQVSSLQVRRDMGKAKVDHVRALLQDVKVRQAWIATRGAAPCEADVEALMADLNPLMRAQAEKAARLIDGALDTYRVLRAENLKVASSTGYTRDMMEPVLREAAAQGYKPDHLVCSGETPAGRPSPLMIYKACAELGVWPLSRVVKVDDTEAGVAEGRAAGCFTVGLSTSGNGLGLTPLELAALPAAERAARISAVVKSLQESGADVVIGGVADLIPALRQARHSP
jgi:phosphonoacetaldehyde hydrolase